MNKFRNEMMAATSAAVLAATAGAAQAGEWAIVSVNGAGALGEATVTFNPDGTFGGSTGCNGFQGAGRTAGGQLVVNAPVAATRMACPGDALTAQDDAILGLFQDVVDVAYDPFLEKLTLTRDGVHLTLTAPGAVSVPGATPPPVAPDPAAPSVFDASFVNVFGISGHLNIHAEPNVSSRTIGRADAGTLFRSNGCQTGGAHDWCNVVFLDASGTEGWAAAEFLEPAGAAIRAGLGVFDQVGNLPCSVSADPSLAECDFGLARDADGTVVLTVFGGPGVQRFFTFIDGAFAYTDTSEAGGGFDVSATRDSDRTLVTLGGERYEIADWILDGQ